jgi:hypothetical protein
VYDSGVGQFPSRTNWSGLSPGELNGSWTTEVQGSIARHDHLTNAVLSKDHYQELWVLILWEKNRLGGFRRNRLLDTISFEKMETQD